MNNDNTPRAGLWKKDGQRGPYYGGSIKIDEPGEYWVNLYKNDRKESDKHPDLNLQLKPKESQAAKPAPVANADRSKPDEFIDDDLPF